MPLISHIKKIIKKLQKQQAYTSLNTITIYQDSLIHNFYNLQRISSNNQKPESKDQIIIPVLKSNAYGHGLHEVCQIIQQHISSKDCPLIAIDSYPEYQIVRNTTDRDILILGEQLPSNYHLYDSHRTHFAVGSLTNLQALIDTGKSWQIHLFLNTGINREGFQEQDISKLIHILSQPSNSLHIVGIMSHFANADQIEDSYNQTQIDRFKTMYQQIKEGLSLTGYSFQPQYIHINNSAGISKNHDPLFTASRAGLAFYGYNPLQPDDRHYIDYNDLRPALRLTSTITTIQHLHSGESISYGHTWTATETSIIATIPFGYHEGLQRSLSNTGYQFKIRDSYFPLIGTICMNISLLQSDNNVQRFDSVEIISPSQSTPNSLITLAQKSQKIPYEILVGLDKNIKRVVANQIQSKHHIK